MNINGLMKYDERHSVFECLFSFANKKIRQAVYSPAVQKGGDTLENFIAFII